MKKEIESYKIGLDLRKLGDLLFKKGFCKDISPLETAGQYSMSYSDDKSYKYNIDKLQFLADEPSKRIPAKCSDITVSLSVSIEGNIIKEGNDVLEDPLRKLEFNVEVDGLFENEEDKCLDELYAAWHLDRHQTDSDDGTTTYSHPFYHIAYGGNRMNDKGPQYGKSIILPTPRLLYPPMDGILGIDFVLQNYLENKRIKELLNDPEYIQIMCSSQQRLWKPFFSSLYTFWHSNHKTTSEFHPNVLFPLYYPFK